MGQGPTTIQSPQPLLKKHTELFNIVAEECNLHEDHRMAKTYPPSPKRIAMAYELIYTSDADPGFSRRRAGKGFYYVDQDGNRIGEERILERIRSMAIPPAYQRVWICPLENGHLQATGRDKAKRKQYRYHPEWHKRQAADKFEHMVEFANQLPSLRRAVQRDLDQEGRPKSKVGAAAIRALDCSGARVGNAVYTSERGTRGITTLEEQNVRDINNDQLKVRYRGKHGKTINLVLNSPALAKLAKQCDDLPGKRLFQYEGFDGEYYSVDSADVNDYIKNVAGDFSAKDYRTWKASVHCFALLSRLEPSKKETARIRQANQAIKEVAKGLHNRPATCRKHYIHPAIINSFVANEAIDGGIRFNRDKAPKHDLSIMEEALIEFLEDQ